jgi:hypothetical protein
MDAAREKYGPHLTGRGGTHERPRPERNCAECDRGVINPIAGALCADCATCATEKCGRRADVVAHALGGSVYQLLCAYHAPDVAEPQECTRLDGTPMLDDGKRPGQFGACACWLCAAAGGGS